MLTMAIHELSYSVRACKHWQRLLTLVLERFIKATASSGSSKEVGGERFLATRFMGSGSRRGDGASSGRVSLDASVKHTSILEILELGGTSFLTSDDIVRLLRSPNLKNFIVLNANLPQHIDMD